MTPSCHHAELSGTVGPKWFRECRHQIIFSLNTYVYQRPNIQITQKNVNIYCVVLCTLSPCNNTQTKRSSFARDIMLDYKANLSRFRRYWGKFVISIVYGVSVMRLMCAPDSFLWDKNIFNMRGISPCSFAQIDETTSSSSSRPNHAMKMMQIFRRYGGHWETVQSVAL